MVLRFLGFGGWTLGGEHPPRVISSIGSLEVPQHPSQGSRSPDAPVWDQVMPLARVRQNQGGGRKGREDCPGRERKEAGNKGEKETLVFMVRSLESKGLVGPDHWVAPLVQLFWNKRLMLIWRLPN